MPNHAEPATVEQPLGEAATSDATRRAISPRDGDLREVVNKKHHFRVMAPTFGTSKTVDVATEFGPAPTTTYLYAEPTASGALMVSVGKYPTLPGIDANIERALEMGRDGAVAKFNGTLDTDVRINVQGFPARRFSFQAHHPTLGPMSGEMKAILVGEGDQLRIYQVGALFTRGNVRFAARGKAFVESFAFDKEAVTKAVAADHARAKAAAVKPTVDGLPAGWTRYESASDRFSVGVPSKPVLEEQDVATEFGVMKSRFYMVAPPGAPGAAMVGFMVLPIPKNADFDVDRALEGGRDRALKSLNGTLVTDKRTTIDGFPARIFTFKGHAAKPAIQVLGEARIILRGEREAVMAAVLYQAERADWLATMRPFLTTLKLAK